MLHFIRFNIHYNFKTDLDLTLYGIECNSIRLKINLTLEEKINTESILDNGFIYFFIFILIAILAATFSSWTVNRKKK